MGGENMGEDENHGRFISSPPHGTENHVYTMKAMRPYSSGPRAEIQSFEQMDGNFMRRKGLSVQRKTGKKHRPTAELLPRVKNFHWYSIYKMAKDAP